MCFLMAMEEEPVRSLRSVMAVMIPALYDMVAMLLLVIERGRVDLWETMIGRFKSVRSSDVSQKGRERLQHQPLEAVNEGQPKNLPMTDVYVQCTANTYQSSQR